MKKAHRTRLVTRLITTFAVLALGANMAVPARADSSGELFGTLLGAGVGGVIGNQFGGGGGKVVATTAGILAGGLIGNSIGHAADQENGYYDYSRSTYPGYYPAPTYYYPLPYEANYVAPPAPPPPPPTTYVDDDGSYCRDISQTVHMSGRIQETYGTACLQPDGTWRVVQ